VEKRREGRGGGEGVVSARTRDEMYKGADGATATRVTSTESIIHARKSHEVDEDG
jgi:hypothetical protein